MTTQLQAIVERITYGNAATGYAIARANSAGTEVTLVGELFGLAPGEALEAVGSWETHSRYGRQFRVTRWQRQMPTSREGIERYLSSGLIKGIGPKFAARLVAHFGEQTLAVIDAHPARLQEMPGLGAARAAAIQAAWREQRQVRDLIALLERHQLPGTLASSIYRAYGEQSLHIVRTRPFDLLHKIPGVGFPEVDRLARDIGLPDDADPRLQAGLLWTLQDTQEKGSMALPAAVLLQTAARVLGASIEALAATLEQLVETAAIRLETEENTRQAWCWLPLLWDLEESVAQHLRRRTQRPSEIHPQLDVLLAEIERGENVVLSDLQRTAVLKASSSRLFVLTGGPGTGKTTTLATLVKLLARCEFVVKCASPTGRAARRLAEVTQLEAQTVHRLLEYSPGDNRFTRDEARPVEADVVLIDEASMLDIFTFERLLAALPPLAQLVLVGDTDQLPSIGPGQVLKDLLNVPSIPQVRLTQVFRQAQGSDMVSNAHRIREGFMPTWRAPSKDFRSDCYFLEAHGEQEIQALLLKVVCSSLPRRLGLDPLQDIQVLTPKNQGALGAQRLNLVLQNALNPQRADMDQAPKWAQAFRAGDKVIQQTNNYDKGVINGDIGWVRTWNAEASSIEIEIGGQRVGYQASDIQELALAYAITVHKSQGSEFPAVVLPISRLHHPMLQRHLLYTALTRARQIVVLIGESTAVAEAISRVETNQRHTRLAQRLREPQ